MGLSRLELINPVFSARFLWESVVHADDRIGLGFSTQEPVNERDAWVRAYESNLNRLLAVSSIVGWTLGLVGGASYLLSLVR